MVKEISNSIKGLHVASTLVLKGAQQITMYTHIISCSQVTQDKLAQDASL